MSDIPCAVHRCDENATVYYYFYGCLEVALCGKHFRTAAYQHRAIMDAEEGLRRFLDATMPNVKKRYIPQREKRGQE